MAEKYMSSLFFSLLALRLTTSEFKLIQASSILNTKLEFSKYQSVFEIFQSCSVHISSLQNYNMELQESYILSCHSFTNITCVTIQTGIRQTNTIQNVKPFNNMTLQDYRNLTFFEDLTPVHPKIFSNFHFTSLCLLQIPHVPGFTFESLEEYFLRILKIDKDNYVAKPRKLKLPDYVLLPFARNKLTNRIPIIDLSFTPKIILLDPYNYNIYLGCTPCLQGYNVFPLYRLTSIPFISFPDLYFISTLQILPQNIDKFWKESFFGAHSLQKDIFNNWVEPPDDYCPYSGKIWELSKFFTSYTPVRCIEYYIRKSINCTSISCIQVLRSNFKFGKHSELQHISAYGSQIHGFRYSIFINKQVTKYLGFGTNITAFLAPFDILGWVVITATFFLLGIVLFKSHLRGNPYFWLFAVTLEQETSKRSSVNKSNWHVIILWMFASQLLRILYGSSLYTYMTKEGEPIDIPRTFTDLVRNNSLKLLSDWTTLHHFIQQSNLVYQEYALTQLWKSSLEKYWWYKTNDLDALRILAGDKFSGDTNKQYICQWLTAANINIPKNVNVTFIKSNASIHQSCEDWPRFALVYHTSSAGYTFTEDMSVYAKLLLILFGRYKALENGDHLRFSEMYFWTFDKRNYVFELADSKLAALIESGIFFMQNHCFEIRIQLNVLAGFLNRQTSKSSWSKLSLAFQMVSKHTSIGWSKKVSRLLTWGGLNDKPGVQRGTMQDFKILWLLIGGLSFLNVIVFYAEMINFTICKNYFKGALC